MKSQKGECKTVVQNLLSQGFIRARIDNKISKEFLDNFVFHDTSKKVLNQIANSVANTNQSPQQIRLKKI